MNTAKTEWAKKFKLKETKCFELTIENTERIIGTMEKRRKKTETDDRCVCILAVPLKLTRVANTKKKERQRNSFKFDLEDLFCSNKTSNFTATY